MYNYNMVIMLIDYFMPIFSSLMLIICVMVGVAFLTLFERSVLGYIQIRKGPNKVGFMGIVQPFNDAIKLFSKEQTYPYISNYMLYYFSPIFSLFLSLLVWLCAPFTIKLFSFNLGILFFLCCLSMGVYSIMLAGWSSNSSYSLLGGLRAVAQTISYEVSLALILLSMIFLISSFNFLMFFYFQMNIWFLIMCFPLMMVWFCTSLAETNRTPFDFAEGESELVSGFNVEYSSGSFALIFLAEYASILFMSFIFVIIFLGGDMMNLFFFFKLCFLSFLFIWIRGTMPRFRYDKLMNMAWKSYLPFSLNFLMYIIGLKLLLFVLYNYF